MKKLADLRVLRADDPALNPESELVSPFQTQEIRSSKCYLPQHH